MPERVKGVSPMKLVKTLFAVMILLAVSPAVAQTFSDPAPY
jgi:hypothetical protein